MEPSTPDFAALELQYRTALLEDILPFWERHSLDLRNGGYFSCLNRDGSVYDTDKYIWLQCREAWLYSMLYNRLEQRGRWLEIAGHGIGFLREHGTDSDGNWYFSLTREGVPLIQPYNIFSDCFAAMAFSQYALASGDQAAADIALQTYRNILARRENPKGKYSKAVPGTRPMRAYALPMIVLNLAKELQWLLKPAEYDSLVDQSVQEVCGAFMDRNRRLIFEYVSPSGSHVDTFEGRLINPGHGIEGMWFLMDLARDAGDQSLINDAVEVILSTLQFGWDDRYGGVFYFADAEGKPPQQLEWDQKLWWVHVEALIAISMAYLLTGRTDCLAWLQRLHDYTWNHFPDPQYGEWYGYLNRRGEILLPIKGGKWKGCFHIPRGLYRCAQIFSELSRRQSSQSNVRTQ